MNEATVINPNQYGDWQNSSRLPTSGRFKGEEIWFAPTTDVAQMRSPLHLGVAGEYLYASYGNLIAVMKRADGSLVWKREINGNHPSLLTGGGILALDHVGYYVILDFDGKPIREHSLTFVNQETRLLYVTEPGDEMAYAYRTYPTAISTPDQQRYEPFTEFVRYEAAGQNIIWSYRLPQIASGVVQSSDGSVVYLFTVNRVYSIPADAGSKDAVTVIEGDRVVSCAVQPEGDVLIFDVFEGQARLRRVTQAGEVIWEALIDGTAVSPQPPAVGLDGSVYVVVGNKLHRVVDGKISWEYALPATPDNIHLSVLGDNTVLAAAGNALVHLSESGEEILNKIMETPLSGRPVVDEEGKIYIGGNDGIRCFE